MIIYVTYVSIMKPGVILFLKELSVLVSSNAGLANDETRKTSANHE